MFLYAQVSTQCEQSDGFRFLYFSQGAARRLHARDEVAEAAHRRPGRHGDHRVCGQVSRLLQLTLAKSNGYNLHVRVPGTLFLTLKLYLPGIRLQFRLHFIPTTNTSHPPLRLMSQDKEAAVLKPCPNTVKSPSLRFALLDDSYL